MKQRQTKIPTQIREALTHAGIRPRDQVRVLEEVLGVSNPTARRLLNGQANWTEAEIDAALAHVGLSFTGLQIAKSNIGDSEMAGESIKTVRSEPWRCHWNVAGYDVPCKVYLAQPPMPPPIASDDLCLLVTQDQAGTRIAKMVRSSRAVDGKSSLLAISSIVITPQYENSGPLVALLDDDTQFLNLVGRLLENHGFRVETFSTGGDLVDRAQRTPEIDIFLMDWSLQGKTTIVDYLDRLRELHPHTVMAVMSGHIGSTLAMSDESDSRYIAVANQYDLTMMTKPLSGVVIVRTLIGQYRAQQERKRRAMG